MQTHYLNRALTLLLAALPFPAIAEEGGSGHYFPGSMSSFVDGVPAAEAVIVRLNALTYDGSIDANVTVPIAGLAAANVDVDLTGLGITALWRPPFGGIGEHWSYAMAVTVPVVDLTVKADVRQAGQSGGPVVRRSESVNGLGDILLFPVMLNYNVSDALNVNFRLGIYAPTGDYEKGKLANEGKNFWTYEPLVAAIYLNPKTGIEASAFLGFDFNTENDATDYQSGTQGHLELTLAQHFPLWGGGAGAGVSAFWYEQLEGDSGTGATFGDFKARSFGVGPVVSYSHKLGSADFVAEFKWLHEFEVEKRPEGDTLFLKAMLKFQ